MALAAARLGRFFREHRAEALLLLAGCALRPLLLGAKSLWFDEANTLAVARTPLDSILVLVRDMEGAPPLHYLLMHFWVPLFSDAVVGLRAFSAACGAASLVVFALLARRVLPGLPVLCLSLAGLSSFWIHFAQEGRTYALFLLLSLSATLVLLIAEEKRSWKPRSAYAALGLLGLFTHNFFAFVLLANAAYLLWTRRARPRALLPWAAAYGAILALYLPWLPSLAAQTQGWSQSSVLATPFGLRQLGHVVGTMVFDAGFLDFAWPGWTAALGLGVLAAVAVLLARGGEADPLLLIHVVVPLAAAKGLELVVGHAVTQARYLIFVSPFLYLLLASLAGRGGGAFRAARLGLVALFAAGTAAYFASSVAVDPRLTRLSAVLGEADSRAPVVHLDPYYYTPLRYHYLRQRPHYLAGEPPRKLNWAALPGYRAVLTYEELARQGLVLVVDPLRRFFPGRVGTAEGRELARLLREPSARDAEGFDPPGIPDL